MYKRQGSRNAIDRDDIEETVFHPFRDLGDTVRMRSRSDQRNQRHVVFTKHIQQFPAVLTDNIHGKHSIHSRGFGHVGGSMDLADLMAVLYGEVMKFDPKNPRWEDRDWLVLSKGHAGPVAYATFGLMGFYPMEEAYTLNQPHTKFPSHTDRKLTPGVDLTTGSLGQGASTAAGAALGNKIDGRTNHVFCVIGDGEADEGQVWESFQFAYAHKLDNLIYFIDKNGYQLDGPTDDILAHGDLAKKAESFGLYTQEIDGHDVQAIYDAIQNAYAKKGVPSCIVLDTCKGKGATFAEPKHDHSSQPNEEQWAEAIAASEKALEAVKNA
mgnify:CR=1 FL=1